MSKSHYNLLIACLLCMRAQGTDDRYPVVKDGKVGFIDSQGKIVIPLRFFPIGDMAHFEDGLAPVIGPDGSGYIDISGQFAIGPHRNWVMPRPFHEGVAAVLVTGEKGQNFPVFIDREGKVIYKGLGASEHAYFSGGLLPFFDGKKWGFVDRNFRWIIAAKYDFADVFSQGLAQVGIGPKCGYVDRAGHEMIAVKYDACWRFSDGLARVKLSIPTGKAWMTTEGPRSVHEERFGFVGSSGAEVIPSQFESATDFGEGRAFAKPQGSGRQAIIDKQGNVVHLPEFDEASPFHEGLAAVSEGGKYGYVDVRGAWVIEPAFIGADSFINGLARVAWRGAYGYIDKSGALIWRTEAK